MNQSTLLELTFIPMVPRFLNSIFILYRWHFLNNCKPNIRVHVYMYLTYRQTLMVWVKIFELNFKIERCYSRRTFLHRYYWNIVMPFARTLRNPLGIGYPKAKCRCHSLKREQIKKNDLKWGTKGKINTQESTLE